MKKREFLESYIQSTRRINLAITLEYSPILIYYWTLFSIKSSSQMRVTTMMILLWALRSKMLKGVLIQIFHTKMFVIFLAIKEMHIMANQSASFILQNIVLIMIKVMSSVSIKYFQRELKRNIDLYCNF